MKSSTLCDRILECLQESGCGDYDQRSALGIAETWLRTGKITPRQVNTPELYKRRDDLAEALVLLIEDQDRKIVWKALSNARLEVNAPYRDVTMNGLTPGWKKTQKENAFK